MYIEFHWADCNTSTDNRQVSIDSEASELKFDSIQKPDNTSQPSEVDTPSVLVSLEHTQLTTSVIETQTAVGDAKTLLSDETEQFSKDEITVELSETSQEGEIDGNDKPMIISQEHSPSHTLTTDQSQADYSSQINGIINFI